jgi:hypothetical protein
MRRLNINLEKNGFFSSHKLSNLHSNLQDDKYRHLFDKFCNITYISLLLGYDQAITPTTDLFKFIDTESIDKLRNESTILIFDATFEGYGKEDLPLEMCLSYNAQLHNINPSKIFLFTGNFLETSNSINVIPIYLLDIGWNIDEIPKSYKIAHSRCSKNLEKIILSLSRRNRFDRILAHFALWNSKLKQESIISQDVFTKFKIIPDNILKKLDLTTDDWQQFRNALPLLADGDSFHINAPFDHLADLHSKTLFSIVNETLISNYNNTSLFFSEKLLKPIINYQPMVIYGQQGINRKIEMLGFKTYEQYFDLSFDNEPDDILRYKKLLNSIETTVKHLKSLSREQQIAWRFKELYLLNYNREVFIKRENTRKQLEVFSNKLTLIFQTKS